MLNHYKQTTIVHWIVHDHTGRPNLVLGDAFCIKAFLKDFEKLAGKPLR